MIMYDTKRDFMRDFMRAISDCHANKNHHESKTQIPIRNVITLMFSHSA